MQKLRQRNTYTPWNAPLVPCNCDSVLNIPRGKGSVQSLKTCLNNSEVDITEREHSEKNLRVSSVYVLNMRGEPLMPTTVKHARILLKKGDVHVYNLKPFTIRFNKGTGENKQEITLGVDSGYEHIGISAITEKKEVISSDLELRDNIVKLISEKRQYRRTRRSRNTWYRKPRFLNRKKEKGWLAPSIQHKLDSHVKFVNIVHKLLPITKTIIETASFDIQKIKNPDIKGKKYQEGPQKDFDNVRAYVLYRDDYTCQACKKKDILLKVSPLEAHHIESRQTGGDRPENLITLCEKCRRRSRAGPPAP